MFAHSPVRGITFDSESALRLGPLADFPANILLTSAVDSGEAHLHLIALQSGWESFLLAAPFVGMVLIGVFRLDELATRPKRGRRPGFIGHDENGRMLLSDPDGRPWNDANGTASTAASD